MATHRSSTYESIEVRPTGLSRRRFAQGLAAAPIVLGVATRGISPVRAQDKVQIKFWTHTHPPMVDQNKAAIAEFMKVNPDIEVQYEVIPNMNFAEKMLSSMGTGTGPDVINMDDNQMRATYIPANWSKKWIQRRSASARWTSLNAAYIPGTFEGAKSTGRSTAFRVSSMSPPSLSILTPSKRLVLIPPGPPKTWDEVGTMGQKLVVTMAIP